MNVNIKIKNKPSREGILNYTRTIAKLYLEGKIPIENSTSSSTKINFVGD